MTFVQEHKRNIEPTSGAVIHFLNMLENYGTDIEEYLICISISPYNYPSYFLFCFLIIFRGILLNHVHESKPWVLGLVQAFESRFVCEQQVELPVISTLKPS